MKIIVTCGPSFEPVDEVRRLTNFSTGELGLLLSQTLAQAGHEVICLRGEASTFPADPSGLQLRSFSTNQNLAEQLRSLSNQGSIGALFHTAALSDFQVTRILDVHGTEIRSRKIPSRQERLILELEPTLKIIHQLRDWFPSARLIGWKYELDGARSEILARAQRQINESRTDACVLNGRAYGPGFGFYLPLAPLHPLPDKRALCQFLLNWIQSTPPA